MGCVLLIPLFTYSKHICGETERLVCCLSIWGEIGKMKLEVVLEIDLDILLLGNPYLAIYRT